MTHERIFELQEVLEHEVWESDKWKDTVRSSHAYHRFTRRCLSMFRAAERKSDCLTMNRLYNRFVTK